MQSSKMRAIKILTQRLHSALSLLCDVIMDYHMLGNVQRKQMHFSKLWSPISRHIYEGHHAASSHDREQKCKRANQRGLGTCRRVTLSLGAYYSDNSINPFTGAELLGPIRLFCLCRTQDESRASIPFRKPYPKHSFGDP